MTARPLSRTLFAIVVTLAALLVFLCVTAPKAFAEPGSEKDPNVQVVSISPAVLTDETEIEVKVRLRALAETDVARVALFMGADSLRTTEQVDAFLENGGYVWNVAEVTLTDEQRAQASTESGVQVSLKAGIEELPLWNVDDWGPYAVEVRSLGHVPGSFATATSARSLLLWYGNNPTSGLHLNLIARPDGAGGQLSGALGVTTPLSKAELLALGPTGPEAGDTLLLPTGSADLSVISAASAKGLADLATASLDSWQDSTKSPLVAKALLTSQEWFSTAVFGVCGGYPVISPPGGIQSAALPPGNYTLRSDRTEGTKVLVQTWTDLESIIREEAASKPEVFSKQQRIRSLTALKAKELGDEDSFLVANLLDADLSDLRVPEPASLSPETLRSGLTAVLDAPWVTPVPLSEALVGPTTSVVLADLPAKPSGDRTTLQAALDPVKSALVLALGVLEIGVDLQEVPPDLALTALAPTAAGLGINARAEIAKEASTEILERYDVIDIAPSRTVNVLSHEAEFPVTLSNRGDTDARVLAGVRVNDPRLSADEWVETIVPAHSSATANVPIVALGSGNVNVVVEVRSTNGTLLDSSDPFLVRVRPWLGDTVTWVAGSALAALFLIGLYRTVRHGRRGVGAQPGSLPIKDGE